MKSAQDKFNMRKYHFVLHQLGIKIAIGQCATKKDIHDVKKAVALYEKVGYNKGIDEARELLKQCLKNKNRSHLTLIKE